MLYLGHYGESEDDSLFIVLRKIGLRLFQRDNRFAISSLTQIQPALVWRMPANNIHIIIDTPAGLESLHRDFRKEAVHISDHQTYQVTDVVPESLWDAESSIFVKPRPYSWVTYECVLAVIFEALSMPSLLVLCDYRFKPPTARLYDCNDPTKTDRITQMLFQDKSREDSMTWYDLETIVPNIKDLSNTLLIETQTGTWTFAVHFESPTSPVGQYRLVLNVESKTQRQEALPTSDHPSDTEKITLQSRCSKT